MLPDWLVVNVISGFPSPSMSPLIVTLPPVKNGNPRNPTDGVGSKWMVEPFRAAANWMTHEPGSLFVAMTASGREIPSGPGLATSAFTEDVSPFTATVAFVTVITVPRLRTTEIGRAH